jgi:phosphopantothenoylcysteine decarboxylase / phosphopantothenate---cysteine ligase
MNYRMNIAKRRNNNSFYNTNHYLKDIFGSDGTELLGKKIVLCITGSVAAYRAIDLTRLLIRHGAEVFPVMSEASRFGGLLTEDIMKWASGNNVVTKLTANLEHIVLADYGMSDLILVYPCTANTLGKMANGIDDTTVTSVLSVALGSEIPIMIAPAMHQSMYNNMFIKENIERLKNNRIQFLEPSISENKAKVAEPELVLGFILNKFDKVKEQGSAEEEEEEKSHVLSGKDILVTAGSTVEHIDPVRVITNLSSGKMGNVIAEEAQKKGANVTLVYGHGSYEPVELPALNVIRVSTSHEMYDAVMSELSSKNFHAAIMSAAVADFKPNKKREDKIDTKTKGKLFLRLSPTKKIINEIKYASKNPKIFLVAFKADYNKSNSDMVKNALHKINESGCDLVVANDVGRKGSETGSETNEVVIVSKQKKIVQLPLQDKRCVARKLLELMSAELYPTV